MIEILESDTDFVLALAVDGRISSNDVTSIVDAVEDRLARHEQLHLYVELRSLGGVSIRSMLNDLKRALKHWRRFRRIALVTDNRWISRGGPIIDRIFTGVDVGTYTFASQTDARDWIKAQ